MEDVEQAIVTLGTLPERIRWLVTEAPTDLDPVWEYGVCTTQACASLARFLEPWSRLDRARRVGAVELCAHIDAAEEEVRAWERRVRSGFNPIKCRPERRNEAVATAFSDAAGQMNNYLQCRPTLTPRQWVEQALELVERLYVLRPRDVEYQHGINFAVGGLEQALDQLPE